MYIFDRGEKYGLAQGASDIDGILNALMRLGIFYFWSLVSGSKVYIYFNGFATRAVILKKSRHFVPNDLSQLSGKRVERNEEVRNLHCSALLSSAAASCYIDWLPNR